MDDYDYSFELSQTQWGIKVGDTITTRYAPTPERVKVTEGIVVRVANGRAYVRKTTEIEDK